MFHYISQIYLFSGVKLRSVVFLWAYDTNVKLWNELPQLNKLLQRQRRTDKHYQTGVFPKFQSNFDMLHTADLLKNKKVKLGHHHRSYCSSQFLSEFFCFYPDIAADLRKMWDQNSRKQGSTLFGMCSLMIGSHWIMHNGPSAGSSASSSAGSFW